MLPLFDEDVLKINKALQTNNSQIIIDSLTKVIKKYRLATYIQRKTGVDRTTWSRNPKDMRLSNFLNVLNVLGIPLELEENK